MQTDTIIDTIDTIRKKMIVSEIYACSLYSDTMTLLTLSFFKTVDIENKIKKDVLKINFEPYFDSVIVSVLKNPSFRDYFRKNTWHYLQNSLSVSIVSWCQ